MNDAIITFDGLNLIFQKLTPEELLCARRVCRFWRLVAEHVVLGRFLVNGPFIELENEEDVPLDFALPIFKVTHHAMLAHPGIARSMLVHRRCLTMAPCAREKLEVLSPATTLWNGAEAFPRVENLFLCDVDFPADVSWTNVHLLGIQHKSHAGLSRKFPQCEHLSMCYFSHENISQALCGWRNLKSLTMNYCELQNAEDLPRGLNVLNFTNVRIPTMRNDELVRALNDKTGYIKEVVVANWKSADSRESAVFLPEIDYLSIDSSQSTTILVVPSPRTLKVNYEGVKIVLDVDRKLLEVVHLSNFFDTSVEFLKGHPLRELVLCDVKVNDNLQFLAQCSSQLELLQLAFLKLSAPIHLPMDMPRLCQLTLKRCEIIDYADLPGLPCLEDLVLRELSNVTEITWLKRMPKLKRLLLSELFNLTSLDGVQAAVSLDELDVSTMDFELDIVPIAMIKSLRKLTLSNLNTDGRLGPLDLSDSPVSILVLGGVRFKKSLNFPKGLRRCNISLWDHENGHDMLSALNGLPKLKFLSVVGTFNISCESWPKLDALKTLQIEGPGLNPGSLIVMCQQVDYLKLCLNGATSLDLKGAVAASLELDITFPRNTFDLGEFLVPDTLRRLNLALHRLDGQIISLAPLQACKRLEDLTLEMDGLRTLEPLRAHPRLREVRIVGDYYHQKLDAGALLTCPRLLVVDIQNYILPAGQEDAIAAYLQSQES